MATGVRFNCLTLDMGAGKHVFGTDQMRLFLSNTAPVATNTVIGNITEIAYTNVSGGTGGRAITTTSWSQASGVSKLILADRVVTASGGTVGPFRYVGVYNDTSATDALMFYYDRGSSLTLADTETFTTDFDGTNGVFTVG